MRLRNLGLLLLCGCLGPPAAATSPAVTVFSPADKATGVTVDSKISATFARSVDAASVTAQTFQVVQAGGPLLAGAFSVAGNVATFTPAADLPANATVDVTLTTGIHFSGGQPLDSPVAWSFGTGAAIDRTAPTLVSVSPADGATSVATGGSVTATFSEPMDAASTQAAFTVTAHGGAAVAGAVTVSGGTATFKPSADLAASTQYDAQIAATATDAAENALGAAHAWSFTTAAGVVITPPTNLIANGSFETDTGSPPAGWTPFSGTTISAATSTAPAPFDGVHLGKFAALSSSSGGTEAHSSCFLLDTAKTVTVSAYWYTPEPVANTLYAYKIFFFTDQNCATKVASQPSAQGKLNLTASNTWELHASAPQTPTADAVSCYVSLRGIFAAPGTAASQLYFDDVVVTQP